MELPAILAGPILRRVDTHNVYIWIATSSPFEIKARLFLIHPNRETASYDYSLLSSRSHAENIKLGEHLFIHLIHLTPINDSFPVNTLLGYNLFFSDESDLGSLGMLSPDDSRSIVYGPLRYPSFFINETETSRVLYGSCRKLHGKGQDALASADLLFEEVYDQLDQRPHSLFLLGDQIYADDVADPIFPSIFSIGKQLMGKGEDLSSIDARLLEKPFCHSLSQIRGRSFIMKNFCQFTSNQAHNHLIEFGEYAAMYLLSFSPQLWNLIQLPTFADEQLGGNIYFAFSDKNYLKEKLQNEERFNEQRKNLRSFIQSLPRISRLLANIPSYMIFDDHDITDDWNLSADWKENVRHSLLGRHVVANGLTAYWAFQGWGNDPASFAPSFIQMIENHFKEMKPGSSSYLNWINSMWDDPSWHFVTPTAPKTLFLDTRTKRTYDFSPRPVEIGNIISETLPSPQLISKTGFEQASASLLESGWRSGEQLIIASPSPLYGVELIQFALDSFVYPLRTFGIPVHEAIDHEAWKYNAKGVSEFLHWIFKWNPSDCFIISGDAHYASAAVSSFYMKKEKQKRIVQFTSSPLNNESFTDITAMMIKMAALLNVVPWKKQSMIQYCNDNYDLLPETSLDSCPSHCRWQEKLTFLTAEKGMMIETSNNMGLLTLSSQLAKNSLLSFNGTDKKEVSFKTINLTEHKNQP
ncbi:hypothetical protein AC623_04730 [Bacillus sp. FJAT-27231]|uniref:hypothetical protein n=1 Tax=Bacillus sp. FJAT-27231 TaxID=1679168 RepID=UPI0006708062|nr:hypothetical protein [Bacillus sp. FJAT-27231]KMY53373.1 hypothetical protein AC623_04730 [Bacillus sp. FJAT-27231]